MIAKNILLISPMASVIFMLIFTTVNGKNCNKHVVYKIYNIFENNNIFDINPYS